MGADDSMRLEAEIAELRARVQRLEQALETGGMAQDAEDAALRASVAAALRSLEPEGGSAAGLETPAKTEERAAAPRFATIDITGGRGSGESLESRIGSQWFNRIGILAVLVGVAWFLKFAFDNHWIGPLGRVLIGLVGGAGLIAWSERFRRQGFARFSYSLKAVGTGILYLSLWAGWSAYHLMPLPLAAVAMAALTAAIGVLAWKQQSEVLAFYAAVGGYLTPVLLNTGQDREAALFGYLLMLNVAALTLTAARRWPRLAMAAFLATAAYQIFWYAAYYSEAQFGMTVAFAAAFLLLFASTPYLMKGAEVPLVAPVLAVMNAMLGFVGAIALFHPETRGWAALALGAFYFAIARPRPVAVLHVLIANGFLLAAGVFAIHAWWAGEITASRSVDAQISYSVWFMVFGAAVLAAGFWKHVTALRWEGLIVLCLSIVQVFLVDMRTLSEGYRIVSFLGLGTLLLAVSFVYQKDWLSLRKHAG